MIETCSRCLRGISGARMFWITEDEECSDFLSIRGLLAASRHFARKTNQLGEGSYEVS